MAENNLQSEKNEKDPGTFRRVYDDTVYFIDSIVKSYDVFPSILQLMKDGEASIALKKRYMLRAIDESWVNIIEDTLPAIDMWIRNPSKYIEEQEEILPIELSRNISSRSLQHLSQHTNLISRIEGDMIIPSKLLNVFREETMQTYENKFINTLINRLYIFVSRRYEIAKKDGQDEKNTSIEFKQKFEHGDATGNIHFRIELSEPAGGDDKVEKNYTKTTDLWRRVERLNSIVTAYQNSDFCAKMGKSYIHPPVMRTNAILKNKNLRQCLELWQFIEGFEGAGYSMLVQEDLEKVDAEYLKELYSTLALQYLIFRYNIHNEFETGNTLASQITADVLRPKIVDELNDLTSDEFNVKIEERRPPIPSMIRYGTLTPEDKMMLQSIDIALDAADRLRENQPEKPLQPAHIPEPDPVPEGDPGEEETAEETAVAEEPIPNSSPVSQETEGETTPTAGAENGSEPESRSDSADAEASEAPAGKSDSAGTSLRKYRRNAGSSYRRGLRHR